jgi:hypothetical protein
MQASDAFYKTGARLAALQVLRRNRSMGGMAAARQPSAAHAKGAGAASSTLSPLPASFTAYMLASAWVSKASTLVASSG